MAMALLARTGAKFACGATSKAGELLRRQGPVRSRGVDGLLPRTFTSGSLDNDEFERQRASYREFFATEKQKADDRHQEYLRNCRHTKYEKNFEDLKRAVEKLDEGMHSRFQGVSDEVVKTKESIKEYISDAQFEDLLCLVLCLETMADELRDSMDLLQPTQGADIGPKLVDSIPKARLYYILVFGLKVALDAGVTLDDVPNMVQEFHVQSVQKLKEKLAEYHKK